MFIYSPLKFIWINYIENALLMVNQLPQHIATDPSSMGFKEGTNTANGQ